MSAREFEVFLARIYVDSVARARFQADPRGEARRAGLSEEECASLENIDWNGLELAACTYAHKRNLKAKRNKGRSVGQHLRGFLGSLSKSIRALL